MNEKNLEYLKENLKYLGFGDRLNGELEAQLKRGAPQFQLQLAAEINKKAFDATLNFRKSANADMYFFNSYHASLQRTNGESKDQVFYVNNGKGVTAKEAYNLLEGRAVYKELANKEGQSYKAWVQLDFEKKDKHNNHEVKQFHENYGYDLKGTLSKYAIAELADKDGEKALLRSLERGNVQAVTLEKEGSVSKLFVEANPQFKSVTFYDAQLKRLQAEELAPYRTPERAPDQGQKIDGSPEQKKVEQKSIDQGNESKRTQSGATTKKEREVPAPGENKGRRTTAPKELLPQKGGTGNSKEHKLR